MEIKPKTRIKIWVGILLIYGVLTVVGLVDPENTRPLSRILPFGVLVISGFNLGFVIRRYKKTFEVKGGMKR